MTPSTESTPHGCAFISETPASIFAPEQFVGDEALMILTAELFTRNEVMPILDRLDRQEDGLMPDLIRRAGELGLCGVDTPDAYGGLGQSKNLAARILEFMSLNGSFSVTYGITSGISQVGLSLFGTEGQKHHYLPRLASGEWIGAYALSEPNSGSDALSATTRADLVGDRYILNGTKMWISNAKWANLFLVMAKVDGDQFSAFLVERDFPGVSVAREEHKMGLKGSSTARLVLDNAEVPAENLLHKVGQGHHVAFNALNIGRFKLASMSIGPARDSIGLAAGYARERKQFGQPIANFGLIQKKFATMAAWFFTAEAMIYRTGSMIDSAFSEWGGTVDGNRKAAEEYAVECSACKVFATEAESFIVDEALQVFGGYGFTEEFPVARHYRDARVSKIYEGTNEINRVFIADRVMRRIREGRMSGQATGDSFLSELTGKAMAVASQDQIGVGALSDLILLTYAEQSARLRAKQSKGFGERLYQTILPILNLKGAEAYQLLTGESVTLPSTARVDLAEIATAVYDKRGPIA
jgi:alkylation response protein AidB-like acyl-CoA dehydrogenase